MRLSVLISILLILLIVAAGVVWISSGASSTAGSVGGATPGTGTRVSITGATATRPASGPAPTSPPAAGTTPVTTSSGDVQLASNEILYQVRQGDTLWSIALTYGSTVEAIVQRNCIPNPNLIYVGQRLIVPKGVAPPPTPTPVPGQIVYYVTWGDTLWDIAQRYGTTVDAIAAANNISDPDRIYVGQRLVIPLPAVG